MSYFKRKKKLPKQDKDGNLQADGILVMSRDIVETWLAKK